MAFHLKVKADATDVSVPIMVIDSGDGTPETGYTDASAGIDLWYRRAGGAETSITEAALAAWNSAHTDGGVEHGSDGRGRLDLPDAACASGVDYVEYGGTITGMIVIGGIIELESASEQAARQLRDAIYPTGVLTTQTGVSDNTKVNLTGVVDADSQDDLYNGWLGVLQDADGQNYVCRITDFANTNLLATIEALDTGVTLPTPASGDSWWMLGIDPAYGNGVKLTEAGGDGDHLTEAGGDGDHLTEAGGTGDQLTAVPWNAAWDAEVESEVSDGLIAHGFTAAAAAVLTSMMTGVLSCAVNDAAATTTAFALDGFTEATDDHFNGRLITFTSGALLYQQTDITDYDAAGHVQGNQAVVVTAVTEAPANNDTLIIH